MKMQSHELIRSLLSQNIQLSRENQRIFAYLENLHATLAKLERDGRDTKIVPLDTLRVVCKDIRLITDAVTNRRLSNTGRRDNPTAEELGKIAATDEGIEYKYFTLLDAESFNVILDNIFKDMKDILDRNDKKKGKYPPKSDWKVNLGGDLEGEWEDYRDDDPDFPQNPFAGAD